MACSTTIRTATAEDVVDALDDAARAKEVKAIVLRIDSPGGTYPASDAMADAVARARARRQAGVVSMGDVAASGGYLAAVRADVIVAQPGHHHRLDRRVRHLAGRVGAARDAGRAGRAPRHRPQCGHVLDLPGAEPGAAAGDQSRARRDLCRFHPPGRRGAQARCRPARRRGARPVFTGVDAKRAGLVDELGGLQLALSIAKAKAGIDEGQPIRVRRFPAESDQLHKIVDRVLRLVGVDARGPVIRAPREIREALARFGFAGRPGNVAAAAAAAVAVEARLSDEPPRLVKLAGFAMSRLRSLL